MKVANIIRKNGISLWPNRPGLRDDDIMSKGRDFLVFPIFFKKVQEISDINKVT